jgi:hypothetical protein
MTVSYVENIEGVFWHSTALKPADTACSLFRNCNESVWIVPGTLEEV